MKIARQSRGEIVDRFLRTLDGPSASPERLRESEERVRDLVARECEQRPEGRALNAALDFPVRRSVLKPALWIAIPAVAALILLALFPRPDESPKPAIAGSDVQDLPDGSHIESGPGAKYRVARGQHGAEIHLTGGAILVTAAPQSGGRMVVRTKDCEVSVVGTVFSVRVESEGSRVAVFEGKVDVTQAGEVRALRPGEQFASNPSMVTIPLQKEIEWSRHAAALVAMVPPPVATPQIFTTVQGADSSTSSPSSIEGRVVVRGTNEPLSDVDLELSRVEGTSASPLAPGVSEMFESILYFNTTGWPAAGNGATAPPLIAPELKYAKTASDGRFKFENVKDGKYRLVAVRTGQYHPAEYGQRHLLQRGLYFPVGVGEALKDLKIEMTPTGAISGRVVDEDGDPLGHVVVLALTLQYQAGELRPYIERQAVTDENGVYRLWWLGPGKYYVAAVQEDPKRRTIDMAPTAPPGRVLARSRATSPAIVKQVLPDGTVQEEAYGVVYYGGTDDLSRAATIDVFSGETFPGADIPMGAGKRQTRHIRGVVLNGETGQPMANSEVLAVPRQWRPNALVLEATTTDAGVFDLAGAFPDSYLVRAKNNASNVMVVGAGQVLYDGGKPLVGYLPVEVGGSDVDVRLVMTGGISLLGQVTIEGVSLADAETALGRMTIALARDPDLIAMPDPLMPLPPVPPPPPGSPPVRRPANGQVLNSGEFTLVVAPGDFRMNVRGLPPNSYVKSIRMGGEDILGSGLHLTRAPENPLQIVIGTDSGTISGTVVDAASRPFTNATVVLVPDLPDQRKRGDLYRSVASDSSGNFTLKSIPPGSYKLFAWEWAAPDSWQNAEFLRAYETTGTSIRIAPSDKQSQVRVNVIPVSDRRER
jgi:hypothetical protein